VTTPLSSAARTLALAGLAAALLALATRQTRPARRDAPSLETRASASRSRSSAPMSHLGLDHGRPPVYASPRCARTARHAAGPETQSTRGLVRPGPRAPDDEAIRWSALDATSRARRRPTKRSTACAISTAATAGCACAASACATRAAGRAHGGSISDVDTRRRARSAAPVEARYEIAMSGSNEGHWVWNVETDEIYTSPMHRELFGHRRPARSCRPRTLFFARMGVHPDDVRGRCSRRWPITSRATRRTWTSSSASVDRRTREERWMHTRAQAIRDEDGRAVRVGRRHRRGLETQAGRGGAAPRARSASRSRWPAPRMACTTGTSCATACSPQPRAMQICGVRPDVTVAHTRRMARAAEAAPRRQHALLQRTSERHLQRRGRGA
jgi:PAS domain-containing protein